MKTDRELLELAAKAAGYRLEWDGPPDKWQPMYYEGKTYHSFDPLTDDGDALRLAVKLFIDIQHSKILGIVEVWVNGACVAVEEYIEDKESATRRAIVRAAAAIGESL